MKRNWLSLLFCVLFSTALAQTEIGPVNWTKIEKVISTHPDSVRMLIERLATPDTELTLSWEERRMAFYGQALMTKNREDYTVKRAEKAFEKGSYREAVQLAKDALRTNPLCLTALRIAEKGTQELIDAGSPDHYAADVKRFSERAFRLYNIIASTGDGSKKQPFCVTKKADEYNFMRYYLELWEYVGQSMIGTCDVIELKEPNQYYARKSIWFDAYLTFKTESLNN